MQHLHRSCYYCCTNHGNCSEKLVTTILYNMVDKVISQVNSILSYPILDCTIRIYPLPCHTINLYSILSYTTRHDTILLYSILYILSYNFIISHLATFSILICHIALYSRRSNFELSYFVLFF